MSYDLLKTIHLFGVVMFLGNIIVTALWKTMADRTQNPEVIKFAQRLVVLTDWVFTGGGAVLLSIGATGMVIDMGPTAFENSWVLSGTILFASRERFGSPHLFPFRLPSQNWQTVSSRKRKYPFVIFN
jgi:uncharacterized membrane protein